MTHELLNSYLDVPLSTINECICLWRKVFIENKIGNIHALIWEAILPAYIGLLCLLYNAYRYSHMVGELSRLQLYS